MTSRLLQIFLTLVLTCVVSSGRADHVLLQNGRMLYNVMVPDGATTQGALTRLRTNQKSFGYDLRTNTVYTLPPYSVIEKITDYVTTTAVAGREQVASVVRNRRWDAPRPQPYNPPLVAPSPAPKATPAPANAVPEATPVPPNVVPDSVPLNDRLNQQLDLFLAEQTSLATDGATSVVMRLLTVPQVTQRKVQLLERQRTVLNQFFPVEAEPVKLAVDYWTEQIERARQTGKFDLENL